VAINAKPLEAWGKRDDNQYAQYDAQPEEQKREALYTSRFAFGPGSFNRNQLVHARRLSTNNVALDVSSKPLLASLAESKDALRQLRKNLRVLFSNSQ